MSQPISTPGGRYRVDFAAIPWTSPMPGVRHKLYRVGGRALRLVEYAASMAPHWCHKGHVGHVVQGRMQIEFATVTEVFGAGDHVFIPGGPEHAHRATVLTETATALFVEDA